MGVALLELLDLPRGFSEPLGIMNSPDRFPIPVNAGCRGRPPAIQGSNCLAPGRQLAILNLTAAGGPPQAALDRPSNRRDRAALCRPIPKSNTAGATAFRGHRRLEKALLPKFGLNR